MMLRCLLLTCWGNLKKLKKKYFCDFEDDKFGFEFLEVNKQEPKQLQQQKQRQLNKLRWQQLRRI